MNWGDWSDVASVYQAVVVTIVGLWAYFRFRKERTHYPHIEFSVDCKVYESPDADKNVAEFLVIVKNKGFVQQRLMQIMLTARALDPDKSTISTFGESGKKRRFERGYKDRFYLPKILMKNVDIVPKKYKPYIFEPGCEEIIRYIRPIPSNVKYMLIHAKYYYPRPIKPVRTARFYRVRLAHFYCMKFINQIKPRGYPTRPRTTEKFIQVEPQQVHPRSTEALDSNLSQDIL